MASRFSCSARRAMRSSSSSCSRANCAALRSLRVVHVGARELVELVEQRAGVAHVAAHGGVAPSVAVPVEPQVHLDQLADVVDHVVGVAQLAHALVGHARADHLVVVELHAVGGDLAGRRLADVVQQRREAQRQVGLGRARPPRRCGAARPCAGARGPVRAASAGELGQEPRRRAPVSTSSSKPVPRARRATSSLSSSSRIRSAETISSRSRIARIAVDHPRRGRDARAGPRTARRAPSAADRR